MEAMTTKEEKLAKAKKKKEEILDDRERRILAGAFVGALKRMPWPEGSEHKRRGKRKR